MKKSTLTLVAGLLFFNLLLAHNGDPIVPSKTVKANKAEVNISLNDIFLSDYEGVTLFIDFQAITDDMARVNVKKGDTLVVDEDVRDLPNSTIYELDLEQLKTGIYSIELKTVQGITIQKELIID